MQNLKLKESNWIPKLVVAILIVILAVLVYQYRAQTAEKKTEIRQYNEQMSVTHREEEERLDKIYANLENAINTNLKGIVCYSANSAEDIEISVALNELVQKKIVNKVDFSKIVKEEAASILNVKDYSIQIPVVNQVEVQEQLSDYVSVVFLEEPMSYKKIQKKVAGFVAENQEYLIVDLVQGNPTVKLQKKYKNRYLNVSDVETENVGTSIYKRIKKLGLLDDILEIVATF
jgi:hypothetical protein